MKLCRMKAVLLVNVFIFSTFAGKGENVFAENRFTKLPTHCFQAGMAQKGGVEEPLSPTGCDEALLMVEYAIKHSDKMKDAAIIVIARLGTGERDRSLNRRRLNFIENRFKDFGWGKYVLAEGSTVKGLGRIEIYLEGKLQYVLLMRKNNRHPCAGLTS